MKQTVDATGAPDRLVVVQTMFLTSEKKLLYFALTTRQVLEVRDTVNNRPVPFADSFLLGFSPWNNRILPVIDLEARCGLQGGTKGLETRYLILRTGAPGDPSAGLSHAVFRIHGRISILAPDDLSPAAMPEEIDSQTVRGIFNYQNQVLIVPDLPKIVHVVNGHS